MKVAREKTKCDKCGELHFCDNHHILPKSLFGKGETVHLCKNCHFELHQFIGFKYLRKTNKQPKEFYYTKYAIWISMLIVLGILFAVAW